MAECIAILTIFFIAYKWACYDNAVARSKRKEEKIAYIILRIAKGEKDES